MTKQELVARLKADALSNRFALEGEYLIFDKKSNLTYKVLDHFTLKELLTANPVSKTKLNVNLLVALNAIRAEVNAPITIRASYHSPEYHLLNFGAVNSDLYTKGDAFSLGVPDDKLETLIHAVKDTNNFKAGEIGIYNWGVHIGVTKDVKEWDTRSDTSTKRTIFNFLSNDKMKNIALIGAAGAAVWFFFIRKK